MKSPHFDFKEFGPILSWTTTYYSGDANRTEADDNDTAWDPMWARYTQDSEMLVYGASGIDRFEIFAHIVAESFLPGDYYDSSKPAYFIHWQVNFKF